MQDASTALRQVAARHAQLKRLNRTAPRPGQAAVTTRGDLGSELRTARLERRFARWKERVLESEGRGAWAEAARDTRGFLERLTGQQRRQQDGQEESVPPHRAEALVRYRLASLLARAGPPHLHESRCVLVLTRLA